MSSSVQAPAPVGTTNHRHSQQHAGRPREPVVSVNEKTFEVEQVPPEQSPAGLVDARTLSQSVFDTILKAKLGDSAKDAHDYRLLGAYRAGALHPSKGFTTP